MISHNTPQPAPQQPPRKTYVAPALRVFGSVAAITASLSKQGQLKDGGPNNLKT